MKVSKTIILLLITRIYSRTSSYCFNFDAAYMHGCKKRNNANNIDDSLVYRKPIFAGKCCWRTANETQGYGKCEYSEEPDIFKWRASGLSCFTGVEKCLAIEDVPYKDYSYCYSIPTEQPYSCCYIGNRRKSQCFPINVLKKSIFRETINHLRTYYGDFDGNYEVICQGNFIKTIFWILVFLIF
jgi:hypothetical protein